MPRPRIALPRPKSLPVSRTWKVAVLALAAVIAAALYPGVGEAQGPGGENDYVDVGLTLEVVRHNVTGVGHALHIVVVNNGSRTAYDVDIVVSVESPALSHFVDDLAEDPLRPAEPLSLPIGSLSLESDERSLRWSIPALEGLQRVVYPVRVRTAESVTAPIFDNSRDPHGFLGRVTTSSFESDIHKGNNTSRVWSYRHSGSGGFWQAAGNYSVVVSVDNPSPSPGDTVNFTVATDRAKRHKDYGTTPPIDMEVAIDLTGGLSVTGTPTYASGSDGTLTTPSSVSYSNGVFKVGTLKGPTLSLSADPVRNSVTLPVTVASDAVVSGQCLTATLTGNPPPGVGPYDDDISDNVAKVCLGDPPAEPLVSGEVDAFTIYPCVGITEHPCDSTDDVRVRAVGEVGGTQAILGQGTALVHSPDKPNREYDSHTNSVNGGDIVSWQIPVTWDAREINAVHTQWNNLRDGFTVSGTSGGAPPGKVHIRAFEDDSSEIIYKMTSATGWTGKDTVGYDPGATGNGPFEYIAEFEKLGTYKLQFTAKLTRVTRDGDEDCDPDSSNVNQRFCATETYIFHFGPIAELEVRDGGASPYASGDQKAMTIVAVNNGPDEPSGGARVTGLPTGAEVLYKSPPSSTYDSTTGEWDIGELKVRDWYRSAGVPEPTLVLGADSGDTANVQIESAENYEVCVGPKSNPVDLPHTTQTDCEAVTNASWNSTSVYDYKPDNNTATITARAGTGGGGPGAPGEADRPVETSSASITVQWEPVDDVNSLAVSHYQVERSASSPTIVANEVEGPSYIDTTVQPGKTYQYRVRAVNMAGVKGPWSAPIQARAPSPPRPRPTVPEVAPPGAPVGMQAMPIGATELLVFWSTPAESIVGHYQLQVSEDAGATWEDLDANLMANSYNHTGLQEGDTRHYRVRAWNTDDPQEEGPWSSTVGATTSADALPIAPPGAPTGMQAMPIGATELLVFWSTPAESIVGHYQLQVSEDAGATWEDLDANLMANSYNHTGLQEGDTRHYRVRAWNTDDPQEEGPWSSTVGATTSADANPPPVIVRPRPSDDDDDDDYAHFATRTTTRSVVENSAAGSPVGNPVVAVANRGNRVTYYLEGDDAQHFDIEPDSGQILVGEDLVLAHEGGPSSYSVVVVADPRRGGNDRVTVTINVIDAPETASLSLSPEGMPQVGQELAAAIDHFEGPEVEMVVVSWQWQRSADGLAWTVIEGADDSAYTPTVSDAGYRLRVIVTYSPPGSDGLVLTGLVTQPLPGELASPEASETPETVIPAPTGTGTAGDGSAGEGNAGAVSLILLPDTGPQVGEPLAAVLSGDGDGAPSWSSWQWQRSLDGITWQDIQGAVADHYYPTDADAGHLLRVIYTYVPAGSVNPMLVGALTERLPGDPPQPAPASLHQQDPTPTPVPVAAASPVPAPVSPLPYLRWRRLPRRQQCLNRPQPRRRRPCW